MTQQEKIKQAVEAERERCAELVLKRMQEFRNVSRQAESVAYALFKQMMQGDQG